MARQIKACYGYSVQRDTNGLWEYILHYNDDARSPYDLRYRHTSERNYLTDRRAMLAAQSHRDTINGDA